VFYSPSGQTVSFNNVQAAHTITATLQLKPSTLLLPLALAVLSAQVNLLTLTMVTTNFQI